MAFTSCSTYDLLLFFKFFFVRLLPYYQKTQDDDVTVLGLH
uniref:Uncharacterized protein n=1 Tax=Rhodnius prolixus TaxID=13249 RepID=T1HXN4_RHOPR